MTVSDPARVGPRDWTRGEFRISTDRAALDLDVIHGYLSRSYWAAGIPREVVRRSIEHSLSFGLYHGQSQVGFARIVTDYATFAWVSDVFVLEEYRGQGLSKWLMEIVVAHPSLQGFRRWLLGTRDAHGLYEKTGFTPVHPTMFMERRDPDVYRRPSED